MTTAPTLPLDRSGGRPPPPRRSGVAWLGVLALLASALYGANLAGLRDRVADIDRSPVAPATSRGEPPPTTQPFVPPSTTGERSSPWWQDAGTLLGSAGDTRTITIATGALQWRLTATCESGSLVVRNRTDDVVDARCAADEIIGYGAATGDVALTIEASAGWTIRVEQQVDVPLIEAPLPQMSASDTQVLATTELYDIDRTGRGTATVYAFADGSHWLRLDGLFLSPNVDLELRVTALTRPSSTREYTDGPPSSLLAPIDVTAGSLNIRIPAEIDIDVLLAGSVVVWCPPVRSVYAAFSLVSP